MKIYSLKSVKALIEKYHNKGGDVFLEVIEGSLGYGLTICKGKGLKTAIIKEVYLNAWSSGHTIRMYNETPKKYEVILEEWLQEN